MQKGKSMKKRGVLSAVIAFALTVNGAVSAYAQTEQVNTAKVGAFADSANAEMKEIAADNEPAEEQIVKTAVSEENLPDSLDTEKVIADGYVARLNSEEQSLSEIVLEKEDGTRSLYLFGENVKYVDENGEVADKSNDAVRRGRAYVNEGNDVEVILPATLTTGIAVTDDELNITMKPLTDKIGRSLSPAKKTADDTVVYSDVFDSSTDIEYTYTYGGVKENIILESYNGKNSFDYEITTGGLTLHEDKGTLLLADESGDVKATLGEVIVFSADNKHNTIGKYKVEELEKNNRYKVTLTVDKEYLTDPDTKYPVKIDPYIKSNKDNLSIQDLQVFKGKDGKGTSETSLGTSGVSRVGWTDWGACRTLLKLNGFSFSSKGIVNASQIQSAYVEIRDLMCQSTKTQIVCAMFKGNNWTEKDVKTWNALNAGSAAGPIKIYQKDKSKPAVYQHTVKGDNGQSVRDGYSKQWYAWDITTIAKNWFKNSSSMAKGLVFKTASETYEISSKYAKNMKTFSSMQGNADYKPYIVINYNKKINVQAITLSSTNLTLNTDYNNTYTLTANILPYNSTNMAVTWSSSNSKVAKVDKSGKITGLKRGVAVIKCKSNDTGVEENCYVEVDDKYSKYLKKFDYHDLVFIYDNKRLKDFGLVFSDSIGLEQRVDIVNILKNANPNNSDISDNVRKINNLGVKINELQYKQLICNYELTKKGYYDYETQFKLIQYNYDNIKLALTILTMTENLNYDFKQGKAYLENKTFFRHNLANNMVKNRNSKSILLGSSHTSKPYYVVAEENNMTYFYSSQYSKFVEKYGNDKMWEANKLFLKNQLDQNKKIYFNMNPNTASPSSAFYKEISYIKEYYGISPNQQLDANYITSLGAWYWSGRVK